MNGYKDVDWGSVASSEATRNKKKLEELETKILELETRIEMLENEG